jgi:hypothetical protein
MSYKAIGAIAAIVGFVLLCVAPMQAAPMACNGEQKVCIANCNKSPAGSATGVCIANCNARQSMCKQTGCWDNGVNRYCGLLRQ